MAARSGAGARTWTRKVVINSLTPSRSSASISTPRSSNAFGAPTAACSSTASGDDASPSEAPPAASSAPLRACAPEVPPPCGVVSPSCRVLPALVFGDDCSEYRSGSFSSSTLCDANRGGRIASLIAERGEEAHRVDERSPRGSAALAAATCPIHRRAHARHEYNATEDGRTAASRLAAAAHMPHGALRKWRQLMCSTPGLHQGAKPRQPEQSQDDLAMLKITAVGVVGCNIRASGRRRRSVSRSTARKPADEGAPCGPPGATCAAAARVCITTPGVWSTQGAPLGRG